MEYMNYILSIVTGLAVSIPLVVNLVKYIREALQERNWTKMMKLTMKLMSQAEEKFEDGATRKEWVLAMVKAQADEINYDVDLKAVGDMIDSMCKMAKVVNTKDEDSKKTK